MQNSSGPGASGGIGRGRGVSSTSPATNPAGRPRYGMRITLEPFDPEYHKWNIYQKSLEQTFVVQDFEDTDEEKKKAILLTSLGSQVCDLLCDLFSPNDPLEDSISFDDICNKLSAHFITTKIEIAERFRFYQRKQQPEESVVNYLASLRNLSKDCAFAAFLNQALRDAFVLGLLDQKIQTRLLAEANLTLDDAVKMATSMEAASKQSRQLRQPEEESNINLIRGKQSKCCWRCGEAHRPDTCRYKDLECYSCKKKSQVVAQGKF